MQLWLTNSCKQILSLFSILPFIWKFYWKISGDLSFDQTPTGPRQWQNRKCTVFFFTITQKCMKLFHMRTFTWKLKLGSLWLEAHACHVLGSAESFSDVAGVVRLWHAVYNFVCLSNRDMSTWELKVFSCKLLHVTGPYLGRQCLYWNGK